MRTDRERLIAAISTVAELFDRGLSDASLRLYVDALSAWPVEAVEGAMIELARTCRFFPTPVEWGEQAASWWRERQGSLRQERLRSRALTEQATLTPEERAQAEARAKALRDDLARKLGWRRPDLIPRVDEVEEL